MPVQEARKICFEQKLSFGALTSKGFEDLSLITGGVEALGHGLFVDEASISGLTKLLMGKTIPGYLTHNGLMAGDRLGQEIGLFSGFYRDGMKVKAQQFNFLNSFKKHDPATHDKLVELANAVPDQFGLSVVFEGDSAWVMKDGTELPGDMMKPEGCLNDCPSIRFTAIESADFVKAPACNPDGLLSEIDEKTKIFMANTIELSKHTEALDAVKAELTAFQTSSKAALDKLTADHVAALAAKDEAHKVALAEKDTASVKALADAKVISDKALADKDAELVESKKFDARLSGGTAISGVVGKSAAAASTLPEAGKNDNENWEIYAAIKDKALAAEFKEKYLSALEKRVITFTKYPVTVPPSA